MIQTITLPDLGEGLTESDLVEWTVAVGDTVELNQVVAEVETAKALVQLPSPYTGVVAELLVEPGATVQVGAPLMRVTVDEPSVVATTQTPDPPTELSETATEAAPARTSVLVGYGPLAESSARPRRRSRSPEWVAAHAVGDDVTAVALAARRIGPKVLPPVRKLAHDLGVDLNKVEGTGHDGMITREDVLHVVSGTGSTPVVQRPGLSAAVARSRARATTTGGRAPSSTAASELDPAENSDQPTGGATTSRGQAARPPAALPTKAHGSGAGQSAGGAAREVRVPVAGVRRATAAAMVASAFTAPHASTSLTVDVTPTLELLEQLRGDPALAGHRISILTLAAKAVTIAIGLNPSLNARWDEAVGEIVQYGYVNLGIAADTRRGLLVPNVKDADRLRLAELADAIGALTEAARAGTTTPADLAGGTITITNIGVLGVDTGTPILVPGQAAILAMGAVRRRPWEFQDAIALRHVMTLSVSFDHRLVDGAEAAHFLTDVGAILARPGSVLRMV
ncbi:dihydrolipoamide acetyltransferase family protein [Cellulomonas sp. URHD0024]|uniref:dihydrolipoamide acetyltransferase family protein n=1 Tax=Cellulomonas sp. URHD0024 TaxID=1302620 RepID=UPI0003FB1F54|nr:dihydrolipoamide acetyltransferase family protein [Cellulomonas sp. URHD0024]